MQATMANYNEFNSTMKEFVGNFLAAYPDNQDLRRAWGIIASLSESSPATPAQLFAENLKPHAESLRRGDLSMLDDHRTSPLSFFGMQSAWDAMHSNTKQACLAYIVRMAEYAGVFSAAPAQTNDGIDTTMVASIFNLARSATSGMSEGDARSLIEGRDSEKLGQLCLSIIDSLKPTG